MIKLNDFVFYDFVLRDQTLRLSPAMAAGISNRLWSMDDIVVLIDATDAEPKKRGLYTPRQAAQISNVIHYRHPMLLALDGIRVTLLGNPLCPLAFENFLPVEPKKLRMWPKLVPSREPQPTIRVY